MKTRALAAGGWSLASYGINIALRFGSTLVLTRLLAPEMYGVMAIATTFTVIIALLTDLGLSQNIIQNKRGDDPVFVNTIWTVQIIRGFILWAGASVIAAGLYLGQLFDLLEPGNAYGAKALPAVLAVTALSSIIVGFQSTKAATATRNFDQRRLMQIDLISQVLCVATMAGIAAVTRSIWALVIGGLVANLVTVILSHKLLQGAKNRIAWDSDSLREIVSFGRWIFVSSFVGVFALNADRVILGGLVQASDLGQYVIAAGLVGAVSGAFTRLYATVAMPALSETARREPSRLKEIYYRVRVPSDLLLLFLAGCLCASARQIVHLLYDTRYAQVGAILQVLAISLVWVRYEVAQKLYLSLGETRNVAFMNFVRLPAVIAAIVAGYWFDGFMGAIWGISLHQLPLAILIYWFNAKLGINDPRSEVAVLFAFPVGFAFVWSIQQLL